jgi:hypothetical protein
VDAEDRGAVAGRAAPPSQRVDLLAASAAVGGAGVWLQAWRALLAALKHHELLDWDETFLDGSFVSAKKGRWSWQNQVGQGHEVDGIGRWPGHSTGSATGERFTGRVLWIPIIDYCAWYLFAWNLQQWWAKAAVYFGFQGSR